MDVSRLCADLVRIKSENPPGRTDDVIEYIRNFLEGLGISSIISGREKGKCNLLTTGTANRFLLCGHVDVVPALSEGWSHPPFSGVIDSDFVWGRGSTDMKGGCASVLSACESGANRGFEIPATLAFVCDEETGGEDGIRHLLSKNLISCRDCLIAEPTPVRNPSIGQKGLCRLEMKFHGSPAHGSLYPAVGISAIMEAMALLSYIQKLHERDFPVDEKVREIITRSSEVLKNEFDIPHIGDILKKLTYNPGIIKGGEKTNIVAQQCTLDIELRVPWGCSISELLEGITAHAPHGEVVSQTTHEPSITDPGCSLVSATCAEVQRVYGGEVTPILQWAASDARHLRLAGFNVVEYGPGEISTLHAINERVRIDSLEKASDVYLGIMQHYAIKN